MDRLDKIAGRISATGDEAIALESIMRVINAVLCLLVFPVTAYGGWTQLSPTTSPPPRMFHEIAYGEARGRLVIFIGTPHFERTTAHLHS
jgi:hypothetical protein